ncbi:hypothetical protein I4U23_022940 [Adineta vaga]|nr:hypothetical protein I4U23_022940 [Adineta vaga]
MQHAGCCTADAVNYTQCEEDNESSNDESARGKEDDSEEIDDSIDQTKCMNSYRVEKYGKDSITGLYSFCFIFLFIPSILCKLIPQLPI